MTLKLLFHLFGAAHFAFGCYYDYVYVRLPSTSTTSTTFGGKFKFLTYLDAILLTIYFGISVINDLIGTNEPSPPGTKPMIRRVKDIMFSALAFPIAMFVGTTFWGIYSVDRELILPRSLDAIFPTWLNHLMHTNIMVFMFIELVTSFRMYPKRNVGLSVLATFMLGYAVWVHVIYFKTGTWVYPVLAVLNWPVRILFYIFSLGIVCAFYSVGERLNRSIWSNEVAETVKSGKKKAK